MGQLPQIINDKVEFEAFSGDLLNHGLPLKDMDFGNILKPGMLHMGKHAAEENQHGATHMHTKPKICWAAAILLPQGF